MKEQELIHRLSEIVACYDTIEEQNEAAAKDIDGSMIYHWSPIRSNIISWLPIKKSDRVLEIGGDCGAVTSRLAEMAGLVVSLESSVEKAEINRRRNERYTNLSVYSGDYEMHLAELTGTFDYVMILGLFSEAGLHFGGNHPELKLLERAKEMLSPDGTLVLAVENRFGMKYWAGSREDKTGAFFAGLQGYPEEAKVKMYSRTEMEQIRTALGMQGECYYPFPDYRLPMAIYSDEWLPRKGELSSHIWNFDWERIVLFDETKVFDAMIEEGQFQRYSNSYLFLWKKEA